MLTNKDIASEVKSCARANGLTFKGYRGYWALFTRGKYPEYVATLTLNEAYRLSQNGYIDSWDGKQFTQPYTHK